MKYWKIRHNRLRLLVLAVLVAAFAASFSGLTIAYASEQSPGALETLEIAHPQEEEGGDPEANLPYLFAVFFITWAVFFAYVYVLSRRQREMRREIGLLKDMLAEREGKMSDTELEFEAQSS
jgi:CcmD family protein